MAPLASGFWFLTSKHSLMPGGSCCHIPHIICSFLLCNKLLCSLQGSEDRRRRSARCYKRTLLYLSHGMALLVLQTWYISLSSMCTLLWALQRSSHRGMKPLSFTSRKGSRTESTDGDRASREARKGRAQAAPENCKKDQDIRTMEQFMHESVRKELRFQRTFKRNRMLGWAEREAVASAVRKMYYFEFSSVMR